jgi:hypothetical protein
MAESEYAEAREDYVEFIVGLRIRRPMAGAL